MQIKGDRILSTYKDRLFIMDKKHQMLLVLIILAFLNILLTPDNMLAQPTVNFLISPNIRTIRIGEIQEVILTARAEGQGLQFEWNIDGPGSFEGDLKTPAIFYIPPGKIEGESAKATITIIVTDDKGRKATNSVTFTLLAPTATLIQALPTPTPTPVPIRIRQVLLKEVEGTIINPTYLVKPGGIVTIVVDITLPSNRNVGVEFAAVFGKVKSRQQGVIYTAPKKPGGGDIVTIRAVDNDTDKIIVQEIINITIRDKQ